MHFRIIILMAQFFLIIMRTTNLTNLTEEYVSRLSYYTHESNKRLSPLFLPPFSPPFLISFHCCCYFGCQVSPPQGKHIFASCYALFSDVSLWGYLHRLQLVPPLGCCDAASFLTWLLYTVYADKHIFRTASLEYIFIQLDLQRRTNRKLGGLTVPPKEPELIESIENNSSLYNFQKRVKTLPNILKYSGDKAITNMKRKSV